MKLMFRPATHSSRGTEKGSSLMMPIYAVIDISIVTAMYGKGRRFTVIDDHIWDSDL